MSQTLALSFCIMFVIFMLWLDHKQSPQLSLTLWIPTIWLLLIGSKPLGIWFDSGGATVEEGSTLDRIFLTILLCVGLIILTKRRIRWKYLLQDNIWLLLLISYMFISIIWSDILFVSLKRWIKEFILIIMAFLAATEPDPRKALESIFRRTIYILIPFSYVLIHYFGQYGRIYVHREGILMWTGVTLHKNCLGQLCLFAVLFLIWEILRRLQGKSAPAVKYQTHIEALLIIVTFWLMGGPEHVFSYSTTSFVSLFLGLMILFSFFVMKQRAFSTFQRAFAVMIIFVIFYGTITPFIGNLSIIDISQWFGRSETLTGRSTIWALLVPLALEKFSLGYGYGGFWTTETRELSSVSQAHNGYLDTILNVGFLGLLLVTIFLFSTCRKAQRTSLQDSDWGALWLSYLLVIVVHNISESSIASFSNFLTALLVFQNTCIPEFGKVS